MGLCLGLDATNTACFDITCRGCLGVILGCSQLNHSSRGERERGCRSKRQLLVRQWLGTSQLKPAHILWMPLEFGVNFQVPSSEDDFKTFTISLQEPHWFTHGLSGLLHTANLQERHFFIWILPHPRAGLTSPPPTPLPIAHVNLVQTSSFSPLPPA